MGELVALPSATGRSHGSPDAPTRDHHVGGIGRVCSPVNRELCQPLGDSGIGKPAIN